MPDEFDDRYRESRPSPIRRDRDYDDDDDRPLKPRRMIGFYHPNEDEKNSAMLCHLLAIFLHFIGPIIIWASKKDESRFVDYHGREALNFSLNMVIYNLALAMIFLVVAIVTCGFGALLFPLLFIPWIYALIMHIIALNAAKRGEWYRYPLIFRMISPPEGLEAPPAPGASYGGAAPPAAPGEAPAPQGSMLWVWLLAGAAVLLMGGCCVGGIVFAVFQARHRAAAVASATPATSFPTQAPDEAAAEPFKPNDANPPAPFQPFNPPDLGPGVAQPKSVDEALKLLESTKPAERAVGADYLSRNGPFPAQHNLVVKALQKQLQDEDPAARQTAVRGLVRWADQQEDVPVILEALALAGPGEKSNLLRTLAKLKDPRASKVLADALKQLGTRQVAAEGLKGIGSAAEDDVLPVLQDRSAFAKQSACEVLKEIGTKRSLPALEVAAKDRSALVSKPAKDAIAAIKARNP